MAGTRTGHPLFAGAKVTLGNLPIVGKELSDYKVDEVAYIVIRYMIANADGNVYNGSVTGILRKLWGDDADAITTSRLSGIRRLLRLNGVIHEVTFDGQDIWKLTRNIGDELPIRRYDEVRVVPPSEVRYSCLFCKYKAESKSDLAEHRKIHKKEEAEEVERKDEPVQVQETSTEQEMITCPDCGRPVKQRGLPAHRRGHRRTQTMSDLVTAMQAEDNLSPRTYAEVLGVPRSRVSAAAKRLAQQGDIQITGHTKSTRYVLSNGEAPRGEAAPQKKFTPSPTKQKSFRKASKDMQVAPALIVQINDERYLFFENKLEKI